VISHADKNVDGGLPLNVEEAGMAAEDSVGIESSDNMHLQQADTSGSANETELTGSCTDEGDQSFADADSMPSAVLQANGEFMCSSCGEVMKCARAIKRHISTHMSLLSLAHSASPCDETADRTVGVKDDVTQNWPKKKVRMSKRLPRPDVSKDSGKPWRSYVCKDCDGMFTSNALRELHRVQMHRPHKCQKCGMVVTGRRNFSQHVRNEHPGLHICKVLLMLLVVTLELCKNRCCFYAFARAECDTEALCFQRVCSFFRSSVTKLLNLVF